MTQPSAPQSSQPPFASRVLLSEGCITLPPGFEDRTTNVFVPENPETRPNLNIARDWLREGEALPDYVDRQLAQLKKHLAGYKLVARDEERLGQGDAALGGLRVDATYKNGTRPVHQRQAAFIVAPQRALIFTASSPRPFDTEFHALWRQWLDGFLPAAAANGASDQPPADGDA